MRWSQFREGVFLQRVREMACPKWHRAISGNTVKNCDSWREIIESLYIEQGPSKIKANDKQLNVLDTDHHIFTLNQLCGCRSHSYWTRSGNKNISNSWKYTPENSKTFIKDRLRNEDYSKKQNRLFINTVLDIGHYPFVVHLNKIEV